jgi:hypothetical protein
MENIVDRPIRINYLKSGIGDARDTSALSIQSSENIGISGTGFFEGRVETRMGMGAVFV